MFRQLLQLATTALVMSSACASDSGGSDGGGTADDAATATAEDSGADSAGDGSSGADGSGPTSGGASTSGSDGDDSDTTSAGGDDDGTGGDVPLPGSATFVELGAPPGGYPVITDLAVFKDRLYLATSQDPLGSFGTSVHYTTDGISFTQVLADGASQGFLRLRVIGDRLYIPDGDPNGYDPSFVHISEDGDDFARTRVHGGLHTFDVVEFQGELLCSNGMNSGGGLCKLEGSDWNLAASASYSRLKYMIEHEGRLYVSMWNMGNDGVDFVRWSAAVGGMQGEPVDAIPGSTTTFRWYRSEQGRLYWALAVLGDRATVQYSDDGDTWQAVPAFDRTWVSDFAELGGNTYALTADTLWGSADGADFVELGQATAELFGPVPIPSGGYNADAMASMATYQGGLFAGSSANGTLYRIELE